MSQDEEQIRRTRVVVDTPNAHREVIEQKSVRVQPSPYAEERRGFSTATLAIVAVTAVALSGLIFFFLSRNSEDEVAAANVNSIVRPTPATIAPTPYLQPTPMMSAPPPIAYQPPPPVAGQSPTVIYQQVPAPNAAVVPAAPTPTPSPAVDDTTLANNISNKIAADRDLAAAQVSVTVQAGRATLVGTVATPAAKRRAELLASRINGVRAVSNQLTIAAETTEPVEPPN